MSPILKNSVHEMSLSTKCLHPNGHGYCISSGKCCRSNLDFIIFRPCSTVLLRLDFTSYVLSNFSFLRPIFCPCNFSLVRFFVVHFFFFQLLWYNFQVVLTAVDVGYLVLTSFYDIFMKTSYDKCQLISKANCQALNSFKKTNK